MGIFFDFERDFLSVSEGKFWIWGLKWVLKGEIEKENWGEERDYNRF